MSAEKKLLKVFELSELSKSLFYNNLKTLFPHLSNKKLKELYFKRLLLCHNRNY